METAPCGVFRILGEFSLLVYNEWSAETSLTGKTCTTIAVRNNRDMGMCTAVSPISDRSLVPRVKEKAIKIGRIIVMQLIPRFQNFQWMSLR